MGRQGFVSRVDVYKRQAPTSWADLWDEQYAGNILMFNNSRDAYAIAAFKSG